MNHILDCCRCKEVELLDAHLLVAFRWKDFAGGQIILGLKLLNRLKAIEVLLLSVDWYGRPKPKYVGIESVVPTQRQVMCLDANLI